MKIVFFVLAILFFSSANAVSASCAQAIGNCAQDLLSEITAQQQNQDILVINYCRWLGPYIQCIVNGCPDDPNVALLADAYEEQLGQCGVAVPGLPVAITGYCAIFNDPWFRDFQGNMVNCTLDQGTENVLTDPRNKVTGLAETNVAWTNRGMTALKSITIEHTGTTPRTYKWEVGGDNFLTGGSNTNDELFVQTNTFWDKQTGLNIRVTQNGAAPNQWINVYMRGARNATGLCVDATTCVGASPSDNSKRSVTTEQLRSMQLREDASCADISDADYKAACNSDVDTTGGTQFSEAARVAAADKDANGNSSSILSASITLMLIIALLFVSM